MSDQPSHMHSMQPVPFVKVTALNLHYESIYLFNSTASYSLVDSKLFQLTEFSINLLAIIVNGALVYYLTDCEWKLYSESSISQLSECHGHLCSVSQS